MIKKVAGIYALVIGIAIITLWTTLLLSGQVPEWITEPVKHQPQILSGHQLL